jgi:hypothetical protein
MRTRLRRLHTDGQTFSWRAEIHHVQGSGDCHRCIRVRVWAGGRASQALQADLLSTSWPAPWGTCATDGAHPTSRDVRAIIAYGLANGWQPERLGGTFVLSERSHDEHLPLPGFLLTDRLQTADSGDPTARVIRAHELRQGSLPATGEVPGRSGRVGA